MSTIKQNTTVERHPCHVLPMEYAYDNYGTDIGSHYWYNVKFTSQWGEIREGEEYAMVGFHPTMGRVDLFMYRESRKPTYSFFIGLKILGNA